jgi:hypothetical protein
LSSCQILGARLGVPLVLVADLPVGMPRIIYNRRGLAGVSFLNETLTVNFIPVSSSTTTTVPSTTLGLGAAFQPAWLQVFGMPTSLSLEWQHTWWQTANFNTPASSPAFNCAYKREDDKIKLGLNVYFGGR